MALQLRFSMDTAFSVNEVFGMIEMNLSAFEKRGLQLGYTELYSLQVYANDSALEGDVNDKEYGFLYFPIHLELWPHTEPLDRRTYYTAVVDLTEFLKSKCKQIHVEGLEDDLVESIADLGGVLT